uniref:Uncharacterized protein n=1 Tax=Triticum urartu TaxID=4572 RepID=A0A8R7PYR3_TRIUA
MRGYLPVGWDFKVGPGTSAASFGEGLSVKELQVQGDVCAR